MYQNFKEKAEAVGAEVYRYNSKAEALNFILTFLKKEGMDEVPSHKALWAEGTFLKTVDPGSLENITGLELNVTREAAASARFGISQLEWALANTGTLVQDATSIDSRLVSSLSSIHIALVPTNGIIPDLPTLLTKIDPRKAGYIAMITGPSRTADIERVLTIGVHGPERLVIVFVDELGGN